MPLMQLIYTSRPFGFDAQTLDDILMAARRNNQRDGITGALVCRADLYVQLLEGERRAVTAAFGRILADDRHLEVTLVWCGDTPTRLFPEWDMRDDPARSWMWDQAAVRSGAAREAGAEAYRTLFDRVAAEPQEAVAW
jgi:hypothetical protein